MGVAYLMDGDTNKAYWAATLPLDEYTSTYINENSYLMRTFQH